MPSLALGPVIGGLLRGVLKTVSNPLLAGPILYILTRGPEDALRNRVVEQIQALPVNIDLDVVVTTLKYLISLNIVARVNSYLNVVVQNNWTLFANTSDWVWSKEVAVVTGGSAGIGEETVIRLAKKGVKVAVLDISPLGPRLRDFADVHYFKTDVTSEAAVKEVAEAVKAKLGPASILINNAGIGTGRLILDNSQDWLHKIFGVNVFSHYYTTKAFLPDMVKRNHGHIVTIASTASFMTLPTISDYAATKAGVLSYHEALKQEIVHAYKAPKVMTTIVHPNWTRTALIEKEADQIEQQQGPLMTPGFVAENIANQIFSCRGGQVILPPHMAFLSLVKAWPNWAQDGLRSVLSAQTVGKISQASIAKAAPS